MLILDILNNLNLLISILNHVDILNRHSRHSRIIGDRQNSGDSGQRSSANSPKKRGPLDSGFRFQATAGLDLIHFLRHDTTYKRNCWGFKEKTMVYYTSS